MARVKFKVFTGSQSKHVILIDRRGKILGFGWNLFCQLGTGPHGPREVTKPTEIRLNGMQVKVVKKIKLGFAESVIITKELKVFIAGSTYCRNGFFNEYMELKGIEICDAELGYNNIMFISKNHRHIYAVGFNLHGNLGLGDKKRRMVPVRVKFNGKGVRIMQIKMGYRFTLFLTSVGRLMITGKMSNSSFLVPTKLCFVNKVIKISCGSDHAILLDENRKVYSIGNDSKGRRGTENGRRKLVGIDNKNCKRLNDLDPVLLDSVTKTIGVKDEIMEVYCGELYSLVFSRRNKLMYFGSNRHGERGNGSDSIVYKPELVKCNSIVQAQTSMNNCVIVNKKGELFISGNNENGEVGVGNKNSPQKYYVKVNIDGVMPNVFPFQEMLSDLVNEEMYVDIVCKFFEE